MNRVCLFVLLLIVFVMYSNNVCPQDLETNLISKKESLNNFQNGIYKDEISSFAIVSKSSNHLSPNEMGLMESVLLEMKNGIARYPSGQKPLTIEIESDGEKTFLKSVFYSYCKWYGNVPDSALCDIVNPTYSIYYIRKKVSLSDYCLKYNVKRIFGKNRPIPIIDNWKVFYSKSGRRYIYYVNHKYRYEVTWIIDKEKYVGRVIDKLE